MEVELIALVRRVQNRDHEGFLQLAEILRPRLWARALSWSTSRENAEDLMQETLLKVYENISEIHSPEAIASWALTILDRIAWAEKKKRRLDGRVCKELEGFPLGVQAARSFLEMAEFSESTDELQIALNEMPQGDRELLALRFGSEMDAPQIASILDSSAGAVRVRLFRAIIRLRKKLGVRS